MKMTYVTKGKVTAVRYYEYSLWQRTDELAQMLLELYVRYDEASKKQSREA